MNVEYRPFVPRRNIVTGRKQIDVSPASYLLPCHLMLRSQTLGCVLHFYMPFFKIYDTFFKIWLNRRDRVDCSPLVVIIYNLLIQVPRNVYARDLTSPFLSLY